MSSNGRHHKMQLVAPGADVDEAAAIAAAIESFLEDTASVRRPAEPGVSAWLRAGLLENVRLDPGLPDPWGGLRIR